MIRKIITMGIIIMLILSSCIAPALGAQAVDTYFNFHFKISFAADDSTVNTFAPLVKIPSTDVGFVPIPLSYGTITINDTVANTIKGTDDYFQFYFCPVDEYTYDYAVLEDFSASDEEFYYLTGDQSLTPVKASSLTHNISNNIHIYLLDSDIVGFPNSALVSADNRIIAVYLGKTTENKRIFVMPTLETVVATFNAAASGSSGSGSSGSGSGSGRSGSGQAASSSSALPKITLAATKEMPSPWEQSWWIAAIGAAALIAGLVTLIILLNKKSGAGFCLSALTSDLNQREYPLKKRVTIGRDSSKCTIAFPSSAEGVSRVHCTVELVKGRILLKDMGSAYGTYLADGKKLEQGESYELRVGDRFYLGKRNANGFAVQTAKKG